VVISVRSGGFAGALALSLGIAAPAVALPPLQFDQPCYAEGAPITVRGSGFTANGPIDLLGGRDGKGGGYELQADAAGNLAAQLQAPEADRFLKEDERTGVMEFVANDRTRANDGGPPDFDSEAAPGRFTLSRWGASIALRVSEQRPRPGVGVLFDAYGFASAAGKPLYAHWTRGGKRLATTRLGSAQGPCGNVRVARKAFPFRRARAGTYRVFVGPSATDHRAAPSISFNVPLAKRDATA
jgi:hypothetical protein